MSAPTAIVIGGGWAGVEAAKGLEAKGYKVSVLEGRDRLGGRTHRILYELKTPDGTVKPYYFEAGAGYIGKAQTKLFEMASTTFPEKEAAIIDDPERVEEAIGVDGINVELFNTTEGEKRFAYSSGWMGISGVPSGLSLVEYLELGIMIVAETAVEYMVDVNEPHKSDGAKLWDSMSVWEWVQTFSPSSGCSSLFRMSVRGPWSEEPENINFLWWVWYCKANGGYLYVINDWKGGPQQYRLVEGFEALVNHEAASLHDVQKGCNVTEIKALPNNKISVIYQTVVFGKDKPLMEFNVAVDKVVVAMSPTMAGKITYSPPVSPARQLWNQQAMGVTLKVNFVYEMAWWRNNSRGDDNSCYTGYYSSDIEVVWVMDVSSQDNAVYGLMCFIVADHARALKGKTDEDIAAVCVQGMAQAFNNSIDPPKYEKVFVETWNDQTPFSFGGPVTICRSKGIVSQIGPLLLNPAEMDGRLWFCGSDYSLSSPGYMDGAMDSGSSIAEQISLQDSKSTITKPVPEKKDEKKNENLVNIYNRMKQHVLNKETAETLWDKGEVKAILEKVLHSLKSRRQAVPDYVDINTLMTHQRFEKTAWMHEFMRMQHIVHNTLLHYMGWTGTDNAPAEIPSHSELVNFLKTLTKHQATDPEISNLAQQIAQQFQPRQHIIQKEKTPEQKSACTMM